MSETHQAEEQIKQPEPQQEEVPNEEPQKKEENEVVTEAINEKFIQANLELAQKLKQKGNESFKIEQYLEAIEKYRQALQYTSDEEYKLKAVLYSNIGICLSKKQAFKQAAGYCEKAIAKDPQYLKAQLNLANFYQKADQLDEALAQNKKLLEKNPSDIKLMIKIKQLEKAIQERNQKQKKEVMDGLKNIGNSVLGFFGLSLDNFKMEQGANGGYSVSFKQ